MTHQPAFQSYPWLYALACVIIPVVWGLLMVWATDRLEPMLFHRQQHSPDGTQKQAIKPLEYHI